MNLDLALLRRSVLLAVGLSAAACAPTTGKVITKPPVVEPDTCNGRPILGPDGKDTGFVLCADGVVLRVKAMAGVSTEITEARCTLADGQCKSDADCKDAKTGACLDRSIDSNYCACVYSCAQDSDCATGQVCLPPGVWSGGPAWGTCIAASCSSNSSCPSQECSFTVWNDGCGDTPRLDCRAPTDVCRTDADCPEREQGRPVCAFDYDGTIGCRTPNCDIGRPFTDSQGAFRQAEAVARTDWSAEIDRNDDALSPAEQALLQNHWRDVALLEHASVASFARHTLELMALGAPADLLLAVQEAAADEVRHAQLAFGLLASVGGAPVGPGPLSLQGMSPRPTPTEVFTALILEGCVGETLGAAEAALSAGRCTGATAQVLATIAKDEARHAALAWKTASWMVQTFPEVVGSLGALNAAPSAPACSPHTLAAHGLISDGEKAELHGRVWRAVIEPALAGLVALTLRTAA